MLPLRVFVISLLLPAGTLCISSHSPLDLFAYPAYAVKLNPASPISNSTAEAILAGNAADSSSKNKVDDEQEARNDELQVQETNRKLDTVFGLHDGDLHGSSAEHDQPLTGLPKPYLLRSSSNGQAYLCTVPQQSPPVTASPRQSEELAKSSLKQHKQPSQAPVVSEAEKEQRKLKNEQDKKEAYERGLALLEPLKGSCLYTTQGWFTYAFCYGSEIRQFHAVKNPSPAGPPLIEDLTQDAYTLGLWSNRLTQDEGLVDVKKARALGSLREILASEDKSEENSLDIVHGGKSAAKSDEDAIGDERRYLVQRWTGGTLCDKTGVERSIEVQFHCNSQSSDRIFLVRETAICEYVMVVHTPRLCGEPIFVGGTSSAADDAAEKKRKEVNIIECRPVVRDELYMQYVNAGADEGPEHARGLPAADGKDPESTEAGTAGVRDASRQDAATSNTHDLANGETAGAAAANQAAAKDEKATDPTDTAGDTSQTKDMPHVEEFVLGSYVLEYDRSTGEMTVNPDPEEVVKDELDAAKLQGDKDKPALSSKEAETMQALLVEFRRSLEEMMQNVGGAIKDARDGAVDVHDTIKKVQQAYEAAATGGAGSDDRAAAGEGGKEGQPQKQQKSEGQSRFTRSGAHNHREIVEKYLKGQIGGLLPGKKPKAAHKRSEETAQLHRHREPAQQKMGTPQFRNLKRAFEQKWDDDEVKDNGNAAEGKSGGEDKVKNVAAAGAGARGHDEL